MNDLMNLLTDENAKKLLGLGVILMPFLVLVGYFLARFFPIPRKRILPLVVIVVAGIVGWITLTFDGLAGIDDYYSSSIAPVLTAGFVIFLVGIVFFYAGYEMGSYFRKI